MFISSSSHGKNLFLVCNTRIPTYITEINWKRGKSTRAATFPLLLMTTNDDYDDDDCYWLTPVCVLYLQTNICAKLTQIHTSIQKNLWFIHSKCKCARLCRSGTCDMIWMFIVFIYYYYYYVDDQQYRVAQEQQQHMHIQCELLRRRKYNFIFLYFICVQNINTFDIYRNENPRGLISMRVLFRYVFVVWFYRILFYFIFILYKNNTYGWWWWYTPSFINKHYIYGFFCLPKSHVLTHIIA